MQKRIRSKQDAEAQDARFAQPSASQIRREQKAELRRSVPVATRRRVAMQILCERIRTGAMKINAAIDAAKTFGSFRKLLAVKRIVDANADKKMALVRFALELPIDDLEDYLELASLSKLSTMYRRDLVTESLAEFEKTSPVRFRTAVEITQEHNLAIKKANEKKAEDGEFSRPRRLSHIPKTHKPYSL